MTKVIAHITHKDNRKTPTGKEHLYSLTIKQWLYIISSHHPNCILYVYPINGYCGLAQILYPNLKRWLYYP